jgi:hypothetical protein
MARLHLYDKSTVIGYGYYNAIYIFQYLLLPLRKDDLIKSVKFNLFSIAVKALFITESFEPWLIIDFIKDILVLINRYLSALRHLWRMHHEPVHGRLILENDTDLLVLYLLECFKFSKAHKYITQKHYICCSNFLYNTSWCWMEQGWSVLGSKPIHKASGQQECMVT